jgi:NAD(P)-dependent dehydrogenase (short-subunit alcohol dehydrogenase family)
MHVVITGANRGLGLALTQTFAGRGDSVTAGCRNPANASELAATGAAVLPLDMESESSIDAFATAASANGVVDVVINNAGLDAGAFGAASNERDVLAISAEHFMRQISVNTLGPMLLARSLVPSLQLSANGRIVNVSSQVGSMVVGARLGRDVGYATSKAALNMVTVKLAGRLRDDGITAIALHPGYLRTDMGGAGADLDPVETAGTIAKLIDGLTIESSGKFLRWDGTEHPW